MSISVRADLLKETQRFFDALPEIAEQAAMMSINQVAERDGLAMMRKDMEQQIAFPPGYLRQQDRFGVTRKATPKSLEAVITARDRATSLARFAPGQTPASTRKGGVTIQVKKGRTKHLKKAFLVKLNNDNIGLAVRLKPGETLRNKRETKSVKLGNNVHLLYGPSVDQVFRTEAEQSLPALGNMMSKEFFRQFARLSRGR